VDARAPSGNCVYFKNASYHSCASAPGPSVTSPTRAIRRACATGTGRISISPRRELCRTLSGLAVGLAEFDDGGKVDIINPVGGDISLTARIMRARRTRGRQTDPNWTRECMAMADCQNIPIGQHQARHATEYLAKNVVTLIGACRGPGWSMGCPRTSQRPSGPSGP
jgi:hypothetical protein